MGKHQGFDNHMRNAGAMERTVRSGRGKGTPLPPSTGIGKGKTKPGERRY